MNFPRRNRYLPDESFLALLKVIVECPKTATEVEKNSIRIQAARDRLN